MASSVNAACCAIVAAAFWTFLGFAIGRLILPRVLAIGCGPVLGWATHSAASLPLLSMLGFSRLALLGLALLCCIGGAVSFSASAKTDDRDGPHVPWFAFVAAAALALVPAAAIVPKITADAVQLAAPIYDHSKIAMIDAIVRLGLPPINPFFGEDGLGRLVYYYLYYFSAAQVAGAFGVSGWEADIGLTWFAAFSSLTLMMALAVWLSGRAGAAVIVVLLACAGSLRTSLALIFGAPQIDTILAYATGFAGWLFQAAWVSQHLMSATCVVPTRRRRIASQRGYFTRRDSDAGPVVARAPRAQSCPRRYGRY